jgi:Domain of unknown function (DUF4157)
MAHQYHKSSSSNPPIQQKSSLFASRPNIIQAQQDNHTPATQEEIENEAFEQKRENGSRFDHNFVNIPLHSPDKQVSAPIQPLRGALRPQSPQQSSEPAINGGMGWIQRAFPATSAPLSHPMPLFQAKLNIGQPGDKYEQEADRLASQVVKQISAPGSAKTTLGQPLQRQSEPEEDLQAKSILQRREAIAAGEASTDLTSAINSAMGSGQPLEAGLQQSMGQAMGADFSGVKVHTDAQSDQLNQSIQAKAFTTGQDVFFRRGAYQPGSRGGQELIAHELTHVVQQNGGEVMRSPLLPQQLQQYPSNETLGNGVIQRAIAIEAESKGMWTISGKRANDLKYQPIKDTKEALGSKEKVDLTSDNGNLEYVTGTLANKDEVNKAFTQMSATLDQLAAFSPVEIAGLPKEQAQLTWKSQANYEQYKLKAISQSAGKAQNAPFLPQATIDIPFSSFDKYIKKFQDEENAQLMGESFVETAKYVNKTPPELFLSLDMLPLHPAAQGFLKMMLMALYDAYTFQGGDDPKYAFATMPRNRFSEMYTAANLASGNNLENVFPTFVEQVANMRQEYQITQIFQKGYKGDNGILQGPTVQEWFNSITAPEFMAGEYAQGKVGERKSDLLSPPPGQRTKREGLGAYNLAAGGTIPFFELRDFMSSQTKGKTWKLGEIHQAALELLKIEMTLR